MNRHPPAEGPLVVQLRLASLLGGSFFLFRAGAPMAPPSPAGWRMRSKPLAISQRSGGASALADYIALHRTVP